MLTRAAAAPGFHRQAFKKVLVANRGEVARRVFRTLREMGLEAVAVYADADRNAAHAAEADEAVHLESYLDPEAVIAAAKVSRAEAVHPGYGFLAENARFAERCAEEGLVFIGPSPDAIRLMGNKVEAKKLAAGLGVPVVDGFSVAGQDIATIHRQAGDLGFPGKGNGSACRLLIKAAAGGGGKGMRVVSEPSELEDALAAAAREAKAAFGDGSLLIERFLDSPRHVEVQILGDTHGGIVHCFERDCSIQRRHQKVFEESPSSAVDTALRERMGEAAVALAREVDYAGAGTVEFLLEASGEFFFLEMNTRLQVEHPVTEAVTGLDLVRIQIDVAQGQPLGFDQGDLELSGHAIEARLYAEDPENDFLPATGRLNLWATPELPGLRIDSGVEQGDEITIHYDPMLAKVIAHGRDRAEAIRRLHRGLSELAVGGLTTQREFLLKVLEHEAFRRGDVDTAFIRRHLPMAGSRQVDWDVVELHAVAATLYLFHQRRRHPGPVPAGVPSGWRNHRWRPQEQVFTCGGERVTVRYKALGRDRFTLDVVRQEGDEGEPQELAGRLLEVRDGLVVVEVDGVRRRFRMGQEASSGAPSSLSVHGLGKVSELAVVPRFPEPKAAAVAGGCAAPMTGRVVEVKVVEGDRVAAGTTLVILEAMKMEHRLQAQTDGVVRAVRAEVGQMVDPDEVLVIVASLDEA